jgi:GNAT superfamily N-acetyltransferase
MTLRGVTVRPAVAADEAAWRALWHGYLTFYGTTLAEEVTAATWSRCLDPREALHCRVAVRDGTVIGFAVVVVHRGSWHRGPVCYLEDLFVSPAARRCGAAGALFDALLAEGRDMGWAKLYWQTLPDNAPGRALYDRVGRLTDFLRYERLID